MKERRQKGEKRNRLEELLRNQDQNIKFLSTDPNFKTAHDAIYGLALSAIEAPEAEARRSVHAIGILRGILVMVTAQLQAVIGKQCPVAGVAGDAGMLCKWLEVAAEECGEEVAAVASRDDVWPCLCARNTASLNRVRKHLQRIRLGEATDGKVSPRESTKMLPTTPLVSFINSCLYGHIPLHGSQVGILSRSARDVPLTAETKRDWCEYILGAFEDVVGRDWWDDDAAVRAHPVFSRCVAKGKGATRSRVRDEIMDKLGDMLRNRVRADSDKPIPGDKPPT